MAYTLQSLVSEAKRNKLSLIASLKEEDVVLVWDAVAEFIEKQMAQQKGVCIPGLGVFTFSKRKIDVGSNKFVIIQRPVFVLSEKFIQTHSIHYTKQHTSGQIPSLSLNFTLLSNGTGLSREMVESAVKEVLQILSQSVAAKHKIEFDIGRIGRLIVHNGKAKMCFFREFAFRMSGGEDIEMAFRLNTASSIITNTRTTSSRPSSCLSLPRIVEPTQTGEDGLSLSLDYTSKSSEGSDDSLPTHSPPSTTSKRSSVSSRASQTRQRVGRGRVDPTSGALGTIEEGEEMEMDEGGREEEEQEDEGMVEGVQIVDQNGKLTSLLKEISLVHQNETKTKQGEDSTLSRKLTPKPAMLFVRSEVGTSTPLSSRTPSTSSSRKQSRRKSTTSDTSCSLPSVRPSTCSHESSAGQELCYVCHQREARNIPLYVAREKAELEKRRNQLLFEYRHRKDLQEMARVQAMKTKNRLMHKDMALFNLDKADKKKKKKTLQCCDGSPCYVFPDRAVTPPVYVKQQHYCSDLDQQVQHSHSQRTKEREEKEEVEKKEKERLTKELEAYELLYQKAKAQRALDYQRALEEQTHMNPLDTTVADSVSSQNQPVFEVCPAQEETEKTDREREKMLFLEQLSMVSEKQRKAREKALLDRLEEKDMLQRTTEGLRTDLRRERHKKICSRKLLEQEWYRSMKEKQTFLLNELQRVKEQGILLHQQCEKYQRCRQCQRKSSNTGKSNVMPGTQFITGSRLTV